MPRYECGDRYEDAWNKARAAAAAYNRTYYIVPALVYDGVNLHRFYDVLSAEGLAERGVALVSIVGTVEPGVAA